MSTDAIKKPSGLTALANPTRFLALVKVLLPYLWVATIALLGIGLWLSFSVPDDYQQGRTVRIMFVHVPSVWMATGAYMVMVSGALGVLVWRHPLADVAARSAAPIGAAFTFLGLATGSIWGRPMWGTWWEWADPRMMSELILLFFYFGYMALRSAIDDTAKADKASAVLGLVGVINVIIVHYSVEWWSSLHQGQTLMAEGGPAMDPAMLHPLLAMILGFTLVFGALLLRRVRTEVLFRERRTRWVKELVLGGGE